MKTASSLPASRRERGAAFVTVLIFVLLLVGIVATLLRWSSAERRLNVRNACWLEARNSAEALAEYGFSQVVTQFGQYSTPPTFDPAGATKLALPPATFFANSNIDTHAYNATSRPTGMELIGGTYVWVPSGGGLYYIDPNDPNNTSDPLKGQWVYRRDLQVIARATSVPPGGGPPVTYYATQKIAIRGAPLFSHAIFYFNNDLEAFPGPTFDVYGPVHANGNLFLSSKGSLNFHGPVTTSGDLYHTWQNANAAAAGTGSESLGTSPVQFATQLPTPTNTTGTLQNLQDTSTSTWRDSTMGADDALLNSSGLFSSTSTSALAQLQPLLASSTQAFRQFANQTYNGNLQTEAMGQQPYAPVSYNTPIDSSGTLPDPHTMIERPTPPASGDAYFSAKTEVENQKLSTQAGLYIQVTVTPGTGGAADTATITAYGPPSGVSGTPNGGAVLGTLPSSLVKFIPYQAVQTGTNTGSATQVAYTTTGSGSSIKLKTTTTTGATLTTPITRTFNGSGAYGTASGTASLSGGSSSSVTGTTNYSSAAAALAAAPGGGATVVTPSGSTTTSLSGGTVSSGLYDQRQLSGVNLVQVDMAALRAALADTNANTNSDAKAITTSTGTVWGAGSSGWNGGLYVDVNAPSGNQTSVALANGQIASGSSLIPTVNSTSGLTLATNAPAYIVGNFNSDGSVGSSSPTTPDDGKTNAPGTATSAEVPVAIYADSVTILSPSYFATPGTSGASVVATNTSGTNAYNSLSTLDPTASASTEVAAAIVTGLVPTTDTGSSGGVHNLPRFLENWGSKTVAIRGSLVCMYNCKTATGPYKSGVYSPPTRSWGFDAIFQNGTYPPLTPRVMSYRRVQFGSLTAAGYAAARHTLWPSEF